jgi:hypothetical protein
MLSDLRAERCVGLDKRLSRLEFAIYIRVMTYQISDYECMLNCFGWYLPLVCIFQISTWLFVCLAVCSLCLTHLDTIKQNYFFGELRVVRGNKNLRVWICNVSDLSVGTQWMCVHFC